MFQGATERNGTATAVKSTRPQYSLRYLGLNCRTVHPVFTCFLYTWCHVLLL